MSDQNDELVRDIAKQIVEAMKSAAAIEDGKAFERAALQNIVRVGNAVHAVPWREGRSRVAEGRR